ncbi:hypothetical protein B0J11DRAFT_519845 [Dendryphion nanum]|uniref:Cytochrome c oxidase polypeptide VIIA n=1 Tax=Dendryphion nanum TaxID=256645 RepID=A0A9P9IXP9_9PLEO|nr:hypothetical protein B0J11DRAFT_519845 [Dendryphion nanum]
MFTPPRSNLNLRRPLASSTCPHSCTTTLSTLPKTEITMAIKPITGMLRRTVVLDLSVAIGLGVAAGYGWWYGYHVPAVRHRDAFYQQIEEKRAAALGQK